MSEVSATQYILITYFSPSDSLFCQSTCKLLIYSIHLHLGIRTYEAPRVAPAPVCHTYTPPPPSPQPIKLLQLPRLLSVVPSYRLEM